MIVVTGGAGFIGSQIIRHLNGKGYSNIIVVDNLEDGRKMHNLSALTIADYIDKHDFLSRIQNQHTSLPRIKAIFHQGACSNTTEWNGRYLMANNYDYSKTLLHYSMEKNIPFIYASSAAVYGEGRVFKEARQYEKPVNMYGYSKFLFDEYARSQWKTAKNSIVGLRYFNVYGPNEQHKGRMASVAFHFKQQLERDGVVRLFEGSDGYQAGEQRRDFIYVTDVAKVNVWFFEHVFSLRVKGIFNLGTGVSASFNDVAKAVIAQHGSGLIEYIPFPDDLRGRYQSFTQADMTSLHEIGYHESFKTVQTGVSLYLGAM